MSSGPWGHCLLLKNIFYNTDKGEAVHKRPIPGCAWVITSFEVSVIDQLWLQNIGTYHKELQIGRDRGNMLLSICVLACSCKPKELLNRNLGFEHTQMQFCGRKGSDFAIQSLCNRKIALNIRP